MFHGLSRETIGVNVCHNRWFLRLPRGKSGKPALGFLSIRCTPRLWGGRPPRSGILHSGDQLARATIASSAKREADGPGDVDRPSSLHNGLNAAVRKGDPKIHRYFSVTEPPCATLRGPSGSRGDDRLAVPRRERLPDRLGIILANLAIRGDQRGGVGARVSYDDPVKRVVSPGF